MVTDSINDDLAVNRMLKLIDNKRIQEGLLIFH